ncbi:MAG: RsmB/NOP family class I SAM-dependent RNA methyltransferase [Candidatus Bathyarchaeota archaeon]|nr:RsmB/NOP family class I SAM-dependent RNA methyltransferase [Candidatus Bathyarchaeota archaeon]
MSGKEFFLHRYEKLGWKPSDIKLKQAIRINPTNAPNLEETVERLQSRGIKLEKISFLEKGYWVSKAKLSAGATTEYLLGMYSIQEAAAQIPVSLFTDLEGKVVLDACAAPGGKTVQLADLMHNSGVIIALDVEKSKLIALANHLERCHVKNTVVYQMDARHVAELGIKFGRILLDVPCSGNFAADSSWFARRSLKDIEANAALQREILAKAAVSLRDDGEIVYATCSLEPEENEMNVDWAVRNLRLQVEEIECYGEKGLTEIFGQKLHRSVENCRRIWPGQTQGFFVCKFRKRDEP